MKPEFIAPGVWSYHEKAPFDDIIEILNAQQRELMRFYLIDFYRPVFDLLQSFGGAASFLQADFLHHMTKSSVAEEYRFQGYFGFGGKYWKKENKVTYYPEEETPERIKICQQLNEELKNHKTQWDEKYKS